MNSGDTALTVNLLIAGAVTVSLVIGLSIFRRYLRQSVKKNIEDLLSQGDWERALARSLKFLEKVPNDYMVQYYSGLAYEGLGDRANAMVYFEKAALTVSVVQEEALRGPIFLKLASYYYEMSRREEALNYYILAIQEMPLEPEPLYPAAEILVEKDNYHQARLYLERLIEFRPFHLGARLLLARILYRMNMLTEAEMTLKYIMSAVKTGDEELKNQSIILLSDIYLAMKAYTMTVEVLEPILSNRRFMEDAVLKTVYALIQEGAPKRAADFANKYAEQFQNLKKVEIYYLTATAYTHLNEYYKASIYFRKAFEINPDYQDLREIMSRQKYLYMNPAMENYYTANDSVFQNFILKMLKVSIAKQVLRKENYWIVEHGDELTIFYKRIGPVTLPELEDMEDALKHNFRSTFNTSLYSLYGLAPAISSQEDRYFKVRMVQDDAFVQAVNAA